MLKNPIPKVTNKLQYRAIGIVNGKFIPKSVEQFNRGYITDKKGEKIETVILGKALSLIKKHIDLKKSIFGLFIQRTKTLKTYIYRLLVFGILISLIIFQMILQKQTYLY